MIIGSLFGILMFIGVPMKREGQLSVSISKCREFNSNDIINDYCSLDVGLAGPKIIWERVFRQFYMQSTLVKQSQQFS